MEKLKLERVEQYIFGLFRARGTARLLAREIFESTQEFANADLVRAFEDLEKRWRLLVRHTKEGNDWVTLTPEGAARAGLGPVAADDEPDAPPHPPRSAT
ncbi:MAG TPA: hypothetical protein VFX96_17555 [Pyrinomonadaceae bacterium]|nr:hypothetical protein [Pyrinomonadaceae bacterium]